MKEEMNLGWHAPQIYKKKELQEMNYRRSCPPSYLLRSQPMPPVLAAGLGDLPARRPPAMAALLRPHLPQQSEPNSSRPPACRLSLLAPLPPLLLHLHPAPAHPAQLPLLPPPAQLAPPPPPRAPAGASTPPRRPRPGPPPASRRRRSAAGRAGAGTHPASRRL